MRDGEAVAVSNHGQKSKGDEHDGAEPLSIETKAPPLKKISSLDTSEATTDSNTPAAGAAITGDVEEAGDSTIKEASKTEGHSDTSGSVVQEEKNEAMVTGDDGITSDSESEVTSFPRRRRRLVLVLLALVIISLAVIIPVAVLKARKDDDKAIFYDEEYWLEREREYQEVVAAAKDLIPGITNATLEQMYFRQTPQRRAYLLLKDDPLLETYEDWRIQQRFATACLWFQFSWYGLNFDVDLLVSSNTSECDWKDDQNETVAICGDDGQVLALRWTRKRWVGSWSHHLTLPNEMSFLSQLRSLDISEGIFWADVDADMGYDRRFNALPELDSLLPLDAYNNSFLPSLQEFKAAHCSGLEGTNISSRLGLLTSLTKLDLSGNDLSSTIPSELGLLSNLTSLNLRSNELTGTVPEELGDLPLLKEFNVEDNYLEVFLPAGFCQEDRTPLDELLTDWCWISDHCCDR